MPMERYKRFHSSKGTINRMNKTLKSYIAGIIDGEGCLSVYEGNAPQLQVTNTNRILIDFLVDVIGVGHTSIVKRNNGKQKPAFHYVLGSHKLFSLLVEVEPFLILKREQARLLLELFSLGKGNNLRRKTEIRLQMRVLNRRGLDD